MSVHSRISQIDLTLVLAVKHIDYMYGGCGREICYDVCTDDYFFIYFIFQRSK